MNSPTQNKPVKSKEPPPDEIVSYRAIAIIRDAKGSYVPGEVRAALDYVGDKHTTREFELEDISVLVYFSDYLPHTGQEWIAYHIHDIWHVAQEGIQFTDFEELIERVNEMGLEIDGDDWNEISHVF